jgi:chromosome segregation ATPase
VESDRREKTRLEGELGMLREQQNVATDRRAQLAREIEQLRGQIREKKQGAPLSPCARRCF